MNILSTGAVKPVLLRVLDSFRRDTGHNVTVLFATAPAILEQYRSSALFDVVIAPPRVLDDLPGTGRSGERVLLGSIGVGVMVRNGAPLPAVTTVKQFEQALHGADALVYNQASTGIYLEALFARLGIAEALAAKTIRYPDFAAVLQHVSSAPGRVLGLGATTVIIESEPKGVRFAGPLPAEIQNFTAYECAMMTGCASHQIAQDFLRYLTAPATRHQLAVAGIR
ncbi:MAG TPA: substrate-binding domain-containing protein [Terriglobales bacterium]|jgi:molybdate transport system substrate-binding protein|nr:substrate-binding domain-containing protein [Terriglobales bacterium]